MCRSDGGQRCESPQVQWRLLASAVSACSRCSILMVQMCFVNNSKLDNRVNLSASSSRQNRPTIDSEWLEHSHPYIAGHQKFIEDPVWLQNRTVQIPSGRDSEWSNLQQPRTAVKAIVSKIVGLSQEIKITTVRRVSLLKRGQHAQHVRRASFTIENLVRTNSVIWNCCASLRASSHRESDSLISKLVTPNPGRPSDPNSNSIPRWANGRASATDGILRPKW